MLQSEQNFKEKLAVLIVGWVVQALETLTRVAKMNGKSMLIGRLIGRRTVQKSKEF
jgi:hypothetical protein